MDVLRTTASVNGLYIRIPPSFSHTIHLIINLHLHARNPKVYQRLTFDSRTLLNMRVTISLAAATFLANLAIAAPVAHGGYDPVPPSLQLRNPKDAATNALRPIPEERDVYKRDTEHAIFTREPSEAATNALRPIPEERDVYKRDVKAATNALRPIPEERDIKAATNALRPIPEERDVYKRDIKAATNALRPIPEERSTY